MVLEQCSSEKGFVASHYIGTYRLLRMIRAGHACQVWEVMRDVDKQRLVLKALRESYRTNKEEIGFLKHEYQVAKDLDHPNVIKVYEFDIVRGIPFLALELFNALNLKQRLRMPWPDRREQLPDIVRQGMAAVAFLNDEGWVHRDIKPDNFLVDMGGDVRLIDFAIATKITRGFAAMFARKSKIQGTRSYMSPEQIRGETLDQRADVYSFGCMTFELFAERLPFTGVSSDELLQRQLKMPPPLLTSMVSDTTPELADLLQRMMAKDKNDRPDTMQDALNEFNRIRRYWKT
ncbi:MAG: serine/threonine-protein kinase [Pirellulales bacterium]